MTVYVVTSGEYSDYRIDAIFSTRERAEAYLSQLKGAECSSGYEQIAEWAVDEQASAVRRIRYGRSILLSSGAIFYQHESQEVARPSLHTA